MKTIPTTLAALAATIAITLAGCGDQPSVPTGQAGGGPPSTADTVNAIQNKIAADKALAGSRITVSEQQGSIVLEGTVKTPAQKDEAEKVVLDVQQQKRQQSGLLDNLLVK